MVQGASNRHAGTVATVIGVIVLIITSTGVFSELQADLNAVWKAETPTSVSASVSAIVKTRALGLGLVATLGFLLLVSLVISAALSALSQYANQFLSNVAMLFLIANIVITFALITVMFAAIYKILPDKPLSWHDVGVGAVVTGLLFIVGKFLIGLYIGTSTIASSYGAAGTAIVLLLWIYYSAVIFLLGAEFTKIYARHRGDPAAPPAPGTEQPAPTQTAAAARPAAVRR